jgi:ATP-binding cassette subfamily B (MDR/TAP) protein 1
MTATDAEKVEVEKVSQHSSSLSPSKDGDAALDAKEDDALKKLDSKVIDVPDTKEDDPFRHLPPHERDILHRQLDIPDVKVTFLTLYRYATKLDYVIIVISCITAIIGGAMLPLMTVRPFPLFAK